MEIDSRTRLGDIAFAAVDLETTGMNPVDDKIIEAGIVLFKADQILETHHQLVNPGIPIPKEALDIHGINDEMLKDAPMLSSVLPDWIAFLSKGVPAAHNASFDLSFLLEAARTQGLPFAPNPVVDTCVLARKLFPQLPKHRLQILVAELELDGGQGHRALSDARSCASLLMRSVDRLPAQWETTWGEFQALFSGVFSVDFDRSKLPEMLVGFGAALEARKRLLLSYRDGKGQVTQREVTPMGLSQDERARTVLFGYCHMRQGTRTFRLDRILGIQVP